MEKRIDIEKLKSALNLVPHPNEGGFFVETYRSSETIPGKALPGRYGGKRCFSTAIYYLFTPESISLMHRVKSDEIFHFYLGDPVEILQLDPGGKGWVITLGSDITDGMRVQVLVPKGVWQGTRLKPGGKFALLGTTVAPGFEHKDYEHGDRQKLKAEFPDFVEMISALTR